MQDNSGAELKQQVWGTQYVDELLFVNHNRMFPFWVLQDSNYNVLGLVNIAGRLVERYEYTPYGQRTVYHQRLAHLMGDFDGNGAINGLDTSGYSSGLSGHPFQQMGDFDGSGAFNGLDNPGFNWVMSNGAAPASDTATSELYPKRDSTESPTVSPYQGVSLSFARNNTLNDIGHQGLLHDKEFSLVYVRHRYLKPMTGMWTTVDPAGYADGMNRHHYVRSSPLVSLDPTGLVAIGNMGPEDLHRLLSNLESRKNYNYASHGGSPGPDSGYLWQSIMEAKHRLSLFAELENLERRKDYNYSQHGGSPGPNSDNLWERIIEVKRLLGVMNYSRNEIPILLLYGTLLYGLMVIIVMHMR